MLLLLDNVPVQVRSWVPCSLSSRLAGLAGYRAVLGVPPAPLAAHVSNECHFWHDGCRCNVLAGVLAALAGQRGCSAPSLSSSAINIAGGFVVTKKMLDLFKRPTDEPEYYSLYAVPAAVLLGSYTALLAARARQCKAPR